MVGEVGDGEVGGWAGWVQARMPWQEGSSDLHPLHPPSVVASQAHCSERLLPLLHGRCLATLNRYGPATKAVVTAAAAPPPSHLLRNKPCDRLQGRQAHLPAVHEQPARLPARHAPRAAQHVQERGLAGAAGPQDGAHPGVLKPGGRAKVKVVGKMGSLQQPVLPHAVRCKLRAERECLLRRRPCNDHCWHAPVGPLPAGHARQDAAPIRQLHAKPDELDSQPGPHRTQGTERGAAPAGSGQPGQCTRLRVICGGSCRTGVGASMMRSVGLRASRLGARLPGMQGCSTCLAPPPPSSGCSTRHRRSCASCRRPKRRWLCAITTRSRP